MGELVQFPKVVKINSLTNEGVFTLTVENIKEIKVYECSILIWFNEGSENNRPWDLTLEYGNNREAEDSYNELLSALREIRFNTLNKNGKRGKED